MQQRPCTVELITMCAVVLHNLILTRYPLPISDVDHEDSGHQLVLGSWREDPQLVPLLSLGGNTGSNEAKEQKLYLSCYYQSPAGSVPWQEKMISSQKIM